MKLPKKRLHSPPIQKPAAQSPLPNLIELSQKELDAISGAGININHNETVVSPVEPSQFVPDQGVELSETELAEIVGAGIGLNHNETIVEIAESTLNR